MLNVLKKGAMFGLDARIALAIFGALSVIAGASLYSAIKQSKTVAMVTSIEEVKKAIEHYLLDTGSYLPEEDPGINTMNLGNLYQNYEGLAVWNGPYIGVDSSTLKNIEVRITGNRSIDRFWTSSRHAEIGWGGPAVADVALKPCTLTDCKMYLSRVISTSDSTYLELDNVYLLLDEYIDNGDGPGVGKVRARNKFGAYSLYIEIMPEFIKLNS